MTLTVEKLGVKVRQRLAVLEGALPHDLDPVALSRSKLPFKASSHSAALRWRVVELASAAIDSFDRNRLVASILLIRGAVESAAAHWWLTAKVSATIRADALGDVDAYLMRLTMGHKDPAALEEFPPAINVLTFVEHVEKNDLPGYQRAYAAMSEYCHPNYQGTAGRFSTTDYKAATITYGASDRSSGAAQMIALANLDVALMMIDHTAKVLEAQMPAFSVLCERNLR